MTNSIGTGSGRLRADVWVPPEEGCFKINSDAACPVRRKKSGLGIVVRD